MASPSERRAAQRRTAKQLKAGQNPIEGFGKKARDTAKNYISPKTSMFSSSVVPGAELDSPFRDGPVHEQVKTHTLSAPAVLPQGSEPALPHLLSGIGSGSNPHGETLAPAQTMGRQFAKMQPQPQAAAMRNNSPLMNAMTQVGAQSRFPSSQTPLGMTNSLNKGLASNPNGPPVTYQKTGRKNMFGPVAPNAAQQRITRVWHSQQHQANVTGPKMASANAARQAYTSGQMPAPNLPPSGPVRKTGPMSGGGPSNPRRGLLSQGGTPMAGRAPNPVTPNKTPNTPAGRGSRNVQDHLNYNQHRNERAVRHGRTLAEHLAAASSGNLPDRGRISA